MSAGVDPELIRDGISIATPAAFAVTTSAEVPYDTEDELAGGVVEWHWKLYDHLAVLDYHLVQVAARKIDRLIVQMPPQHGKSELCSRTFPAWYLGIRPQESIILAGYESRFAAKWGRKARELIERWGPGLFGVRVDPFQRAADNWALQYLNGESTGGSMFTAGVGGPATGKKAHVFIIDDPFKNLQEALSETVRNTKIEWFKSVASTRLQKNGAIIVIQTRWHNADLAGYLQSEFPGRWVVVDLPAIAWARGQIPESDWRPDLLGRQPGEALCPDLHPIHELREQEQLLGPGLFSALYQQRPSPGAGGIFDECWWQFWTLEALPEKWDYLFQTWDFTYKDSKDSDWVVGQVWGVRWPNFYLLDQVRDRLLFPQTLDAVRRLSATGFGRQTSAKLFELKANGPAVQSVLRAELPGIVGVEPEGSKEARAHAVSFLVRAGNVVLPNPEMPGFSWVRQFVREATDFPRGDHDDQVDAMTQGLKYAFEKSRRVAPIKTVPRNSEILKRLGV